MWTESSRDAELVRETVASPEAKQVLYQARVNLELFHHAREQLKKAFDQLLFHDFARANSCHMTEGIFGADIHTAHMMSEKERVMGFMLATVTAGHRFTRSIVAARSRDRGKDWKELRMDILQLEKKFHNVRNFLEHLDEALANGAISDGMDCYFTRDAILTCKESGSTFTFDFSEAALTRPQKTYDALMKMLEQRRSIARSAVPPSGRRRSPVLSPRRTSS